MKKLNLVLAVLFIVSYNPAGAQCEPFTAISAGPLHIQAIRSDGTLWAWGYNWFGQLGDNTNTDRSVPTRVGTDNKWAAVSAGSSHTLALKTDGSLWAWGANGFGQLGDGAGIDSRIPVQIGQDKDWAAVWAGGTSSLALKNDGSLWAWGDNQFGQLGHGNQTESHVPVQIGQDKDWAVVSAGHTHILALKTDGSLWAWGYNWYGRLGDGTIITRTSPVKIGSDEDWAAVSAGADHSLALKADGSLWAWGGNQNGQLGVGTQINSHVPVQVGQDNNWATVSAGDYYTHALKTDGSLWAWGKNTGGLLGDGTVVGKNDPVEITANAGNWTVLSPGAEYALALKADGSLWVWGSGWTGQFGNGTMINSKTVPTMTNYRVYNNTLAANTSATIIANPGLDLVFHNSCNPIAGLSLLTGSGSVTAKVWVAASQPQQYVKRHYEITPQNAASGRVTLFFSNDEFKAFNNQNPQPALLLPDADNPADTTARKANILIEKRSGSGDDSGSPTSYNGSVENIQPNEEDIKWNAAANRWEISFDVTGFSGFFLKTQLGALPVTMGDIAAFFKNNQLTVNWTTVTETNNSHFEIEISADAKTFQKIGELRSKAVQGNSDVPLDYSFSLSSDSLAGGAAIFLLGGLLLLMGKTKRPGFLSMAIGVVLLTAVACNKTDAPVNSMPDKAFVRIVQVDIDGHKTYSKAVQVMNRQ